MNSSQQPGVEDGQPLQPGHPQSGSQALSASHLPGHLPSSISLPLRTANSTPISSPGLFSPIATRPGSLGLHQPSVSEGNSPAPLGSSPYLHPLQTHKVRETHKALIDSDNITGRKLINQYEVIEEIGRGMHGKVKLARNLETGENVAIKIIPRFSKKRRLGKVTALSPQDKTKKEIAILKKIRHPNVVALLEVIDDPELKKIYMVLEHVELGEIIWRKKGLPHICQYERRRAEREMRGETFSAEEEKYDQLLERRQALRELKRAKMAQNYARATDYWSNEYGGDESGSSYGHQSRIPSKEDFALSDHHFSDNSRPPSTVPSRSHSMTYIQEDQPLELEESADWEDDIETPGILRSNPNSATALDGTMYGAYQDDTPAFYRGRSPSMADSIISHMSSVDFQQHAYDPFADDFSYVPCFTFDQARRTFRDTVLGLEYLHYQGVVHRDIKPANLLWSRDHRVKISDFGVSYFGRPIRDGEVDDTVSESEARDFDNDLELAKTVGTPAFFAPELCYTDIDMEQPKVSEQIDVWSLGVTLYCIIFARIPFLAEDEFQMFKKIATEDVYIPRRRLKPVDPSTSPTTSSLYNRQNAHPYRDDNELEYEDVDNLLYDLLRLMLCKNPERRIRLRDIKRHPWVVQGMTNPIGWLDDTDPARPSSGRKIQVDEREMSSAVVPLTFLERARSVVKKAVGKVIHPLVERSDSASRRRATSSAASSAGDSMVNHSPATPQQRADRRRSLRPDDYFANAALVDMASSGDPYDPLATVLPADDDAYEARGHGSKSGSLLDLQRRHNLHNKTEHRFLNLTSPLPIPQTKTTPATPLYDDRQERSLDARESRSLAFAKDEATRSRSADRAIFNMSDKRALPQTGVSTTTAPALIQGPHRYRFQRSVDLDHPHSSRSSHSPHLVRSFADMIPVLETTRTFATAGNVPATELQASIGAAADASQIPCPPSPSPESVSAPIATHQHGLNVGEQAATSKSSSIDSLNGLGTPLTSPSEVTSPVSGQEVKHPPEQVRFQPGPDIKNPPEQIQFQSDPSLPALLSGASSVSADIEGELLGKPGVVKKRPALLETTESLTPPALSKEPASGFPLHGVYENGEAMESGQLNVEPEKDGPKTPPFAVAAPDEPSHRTHENNEEDDDDDGDNSDDGILLMAKSRKSVLPTPSASPSRLETKRRDTNISTASDETAKRVPLGDESSQP